MITFDTETTGLLKPDLCELWLQPFITEICLVKHDFDGNIQGVFETFLKPPVPIPPEVTEITGITDAMVANAPKFIQIYDSLCDFVRGEKTIFAHNCSYDIGMLTVELQRHDLENRFPWPSNQICTVEAAMPIRNKRIKLGELYELLTGKKMVNAHRAKDDVLALVEVVCQLKNNGLINEKTC